MSWHAQSCDLILETLKAFSNICECRIWLIMMQCEVATLSAKTQKRHNYPAYHNHLPEQNKFILMWFWLMLQMSKVAIVCGNSVIFQKDNGWDQNNCVESSQEGEQFSSQANSDPSFCLKFYYTVQFELTPLLVVWFYWRKQPSQSLLGDHEDLHHLDNNGKQNQKGIAKCGYLSRLWHRSAWKRSWKITRLLVVMKFSESGLKNLYLTKCSKLCEIKWGCVPHKEFSEWKRALPVVHSS